MNADEMLLDKTGKVKTSKKLRCPKCGSTHLVDEGQALRCKDCGSIIWVKTKKKG
jgi:DNA-directed RNA polymerase subunit RPC12/RpoP